MFLIDFTEHRVIGLIVGLAIAVLSLMIILIRFLLRERKKKKGEDISE